VNQLVTQPHQCWNSNIEFTILSPSTGILSVESNMPQKLDIQQFNTGLVNR
jgi:hypothetical protein